MEWSHFNQQIWLNLEGEAFNRYGSESVWILTSSSVLPSPVHCMLHTSVHICQLKRTHSSRAWEAVAVILTVTKSIQIFSELAFLNHMKQRYPLCQFSLQMVFCPFSWLFCLPEGTNVSFIVHLLDLHQVSNGEQVVVCGRYVKHSVRKSCPERNFVKLFEKSIHLRHVRWQLPLHDKSSPSFAPIRGELVVDKLGSSVRTSITFRG